MAVMHSSKHGYTNPATSTQPLLDNTYAIFFVSTRSTKVCTVATFTEQQVLLQSKTGINLYHTVS